MNHSINDALIDVDAKFYKSDKQIPDSKDPNNYELVMMCINKENRKIQSLHDRQFCIPNPRYFYNDDEQYIPSEKSHDESMLRCGFLSKELIKFLRDICENKSTTK